MLWYYVTATMSCFYSQTHKTKNGWHMADAHFYDGETSVSLSSLPVTTPSTITMERDVCATHWLPKIQVLKLLMLHWNSPYWHSYSYSIITNCLQSAYSRHWQLIYSFNVKTFASKALRPLEFCYTTRHGNCVINDVGLSHPSAFCWQFMACRSIH